MDRGKGAVLRRSTPASRFAGSPRGRAGAALLAMLLAFVMTAPALSSHDALHSDFERGLGADLTPVGPCGAFPLGADPLCRDVMVRLAVAGRLSLGIALAATLVACTLGTVVGLTAGWLEGRRLFGLDVDALLMRIVDLLLTFPFLLLVMSLAMAFERTSALTVFVTLGVTGWLGLARIVRSRTLEVRSLDYVEAARALGQTPLAIVRRHVIPGVAGPLLVAGTVLMAQMLVADSVLSFLGVGISPPTPTWGRMLFESRDDVFHAPARVAAPALAILVAVTGCNLVGEGLRDAIDQKGV